MKRQQIDCFTQLIGGEVKNSIKPCETKSGTEPDAINYRADAV